MSSKEISAEKVLLKDNSNIPNASEQETGRAEHHFTPQLILKWKLWCSNVFKPIVFHYIKFLSEDNVFVP